MGYEIEYHMALRASFSYIGYPAMVYFYCLLLIRTYIVVWCQLVSISSGSPISKDVAFVVSVTPISTNVGYQSITIRASITHLLGLLARTLWKEQLSMMDYRLAMTTGYDQLCKVGALCAGAYYVSIYVSEV